MEPDRNWKFVAYLVKKSGGITNWRDGYCICPKCGEIIHQIKWSGENGNNLIENGKYICPFCKKEIY